MPSTPQNTGLYQTVLADLRFMKVQNPGFLHVAYYAFRRPGFLAVLLFRLSSRSVHKGFIGRCFSGFCERLNSFVNSCDIDPEANVGPGFWLTHPVGVVIGKATTGRNVCLLQGTTLGMRDRDTDKDNFASYPVIGNDVTISAGAIVLGPVRIGNNVSVAAKSVVLEDVPDNSLAVGIPARVMGKSRAASA